jgi:hypothetical protein
MNLVLDKEVKLNSIWRSHMHHKRVIWSDQQLTYFHKAKLKIQQHGIVVLVHMNPTKPFWENNVQNTKLLGALTSHGTYVYDCTYRIHISLLLVVSLMHNLDHIYNNKIYFKLKLVHN